MNNKQKYLIIAALILLACNDEQPEFPFSPEFDVIKAKYKNIADNGCFANDNFISYPSPWTRELAETFRISSEILKNTTTCGLIKTYFMQPWNELGPWCSVCSDFSINGIEYFNNSIDENEVVNELFNRDMILDKLILTYLEIIDTIEQLQEHPGRLHSFEILLASKKMDEIYIEEPSRDLIIICLKMLDRKKTIPEFNNVNSLAITRHIIVDVLMRNNFEPFLSENITDGGLEANMNGYSVCYQDNLIETYAKQYIEILNP